MAEVHYVLLIAKPASRAALGSLRWAMFRKGMRQSRVSMERIKAAANSRLMRLAQKMIVGGALLLDRVANSHLHHLAALVSEQLFPAFVNEVCRFFSRRPSFCELHQGSSRSQLIAFLLFSAASRLLVKLPCPVRWQGFEGEVFGGRTGDQFESGAPSSSYGFAIAHRTIRSRCSPPRCAIGVLTNRTILALSRRHPFLGASLGASLEPMLKDQRASVFLPLTVALTITVTWRP